MTVCVYDAQFPEIAPLSCDGDERWHRTRGEGGELYDVVLVHLLPYDSVTQNREKALGGAF